MNEDLSLTSARSLPSDVLKTDSETDSETDSRSATRLNEWLDSEQCPIVEVILAAMNNKL